MKSLSRPSRRVLGRVFVMSGLIFGVAAMAQGRSETVASGLESPWGVGFLPGDRFVVTEKPRRIRIVAKDGKLGAPLADPVLRESPAASGSSLAG